MLSDYRTSRLDNGAMVVSVRKPDAESVAFGIWVAAGGRHEGAKQSGISHFLEHMLFKGTPTRSAREISRAIEGRGGYLNAFTQEESTCYYTRLPYEHLAYGVGVMVDMYLNASMSAADVERERDVILEEIKMYRDLPQFLVQERMQEALYVNHPLGRSLAGDVRALKGIGSAELHEYKQRAYQPGATVFAFAGRLDHDECVRVVEKFYGDTKGGRRVAFRRINAGVRQEPVVVERREIGQVHASLAFRTFGRNDKRRYALRVLNGLLGENMSSRLFQSVRERNGLCYSINSTYQLFDETGFFNISGGFDAERAEKALRLVAKELRRLLERKVGAAELKRTREYVQGTFRLGLEGTSSLMNFVGNSVVSFGRVMDPAETVAGINDVTADDIQSLVAEIFDPAGMTLSLVTPVEQPQDEAQWLESFRVLKF